MESNLYYKSLCMVIFVIIQIVGLPMQASAVNTAVEVSQEHSITVTVTDKPGVPTIAVTILAKGTLIGAVSDLDGSNQLNMPDAVNNLIFFLRVIPSRIR